MGRSLESFSRSNNLDISRNPEGIVDDSVNKPKSFEEHMREMRKSVNDLKDMVDDLPTENNGEEQHELEIAAARKAVLEVFNKSNDNERITNCKNRVFKTELGPRYDGHPNVFRTNSDSVYRVTGMNQMADIVNCGYVRPKEGKIKGGHENEVFWSIGGEKLNFIDERPILETSVETVRDGQVGALSLDDLTAVWIMNDETGSRENKLEEIKDIKKFMNKDEQIDAESLSAKIKKGISLSDISASF